MKITIYHENDIHFPEEVYVQSDEAWIEKKSIAEEKLEGGKNEYK